MPLLYHNLGGLSRGFLHFFSRMVRATFTPRGRYPVATPPLDTNIISHLPPDFNRQNTQNRDFYFLDICATFLLTKLARHGIMEISARAHVGGPTKTATLFTAEAQGWRELISIFNFNFWGGEPRYFHFINVLQTIAGVEKTAEPSFIGG